MKRTHQCICAALAALLLTGCSPWRGVHVHIGRNADGDFAIVFSDSEKEQNQSETDAGRSEESSAGTPIRYNIVGDEIELIDFEPDPTFEFGLLPDEIEGKKVTSIGEYGFYNSQCADSLSFPRTITKLGDYAFKGSNVTGWDMDADTVTVGEYGYMDCTALSNVTFMNKEVTLNAYCFNNSGASVVCSNGCALRAGDYCFQDMPRLEHLTFRGDTLLGEYCFDNCPRLNDVFFGEGKIGIGDYSFEDAALENLMISECKSGKIGEYCFRNCGRLSDVLLQEGVTEIGAYSFCGCTKLEFVVLPASITKIGEHCFEDCGDLRMTAPEGSYAATYAKEHGFAD